MVLSDNEVKWNNCLENVNKIVQSVYKGLLIEQPVFDMHYTVHWCIVNRMSGVIWTVCIFVVF